MAISAAYKDMLIQLMPPGFALRGPRFQSLLAAVSREFGRVHEMAINVFQYELPDRLSIFVPDWERILGIDNEDLPFPQRAALIRKKLASLIGQSRWDYQKLIEEFSNESVITDFTPYTCGMAIGQRMYGVHWNFVWQIENLPEEKIEQIKRAVLPNSQAHTVVQFKSKEGTYV